MKIIFPMNLNLKRNTAFPKMIIRIGGIVSGTEGLATKRIQEFAESAKIFKGKPMKQVLIFRPRYGEKFVVGMQLEFENRRQMNEFVKYLNIF